MAPNPRSMPPSPTTVPHRRPATSAPASPPPPEPEPEEEGSDLRIKLIKRLSLAGGVILLLLLGLHWLDQGGPGEEAEPRFTRPVPVGGKIEARQEVIKPVVPAPPDLQPPPGMAGDTPPAAPAPQAVPEAPVAAAPPTPAAPVTAPAAAPASSPASSPSASASAAPRPAAESHPSRPTPVRGLALPGSNSTAETPPSAPARVTLAPAAPQVAAAPPSRVVESGRNGLPARKSPQEPLTAPPEEKLPSGDPALIRLPPMLPRQASGFLLQAGVFNSTGRAEEIYATLQKHGVPATLEARVQVGPFRNKAEAEQARSKLQALGIDVQVLAPNRGH